MNLIKKIARSLGTKLIALSETPVQPAAPFAPSAAPTRVFVESSALRSVGFTPTSAYGAGMLLVEFRDGDLYVYDDVPRSVFEDLLKADSKGAYLNQHIKPIRNGRKIDL